jgi:hypothetical protein
VKQLHLQELAMEPPTQGIAKFSCSTKKFGGGSAVARQRLGGGQKLTRHMQWCAENELSRQNAEILLRRHR